MVQEASGDTEVPAFFVENETPFSHVTWDSTRQFDLSVGSDGVPEVVLVLSGVVEDDSKVVSLYPDATIRTEGHNFKLTFHLRRPETSHLIYKISPFGVVEPQNTKISIPDIYELLGTLLENGTYWRGFTSYLSMSSVTYQESEFAAFSQTSLTIGLNYHHAPWSSDRWSFDLGGSYLIAPISSGNSGESIRFLELNGKINYRLSPLASSWHFFVSAGYDYLTAFQSGALFGFKNLDSADLEVTASHSLDRNKSIVANFRYLPGSQWGARLGIIDIIGQAKKRHPISLDIDYRNLNVDVSPFLAIQSHQTSLRLGYGF